MCKGTQCKSRFNGLWLIQRQPPPTAPLFSYTNTLYLVDTTRDAITPWLIYFFFAKEYRTMTSGCQVAPNCGTYGQELDSIPATSKMKRLGATVERLSCCIFRRDRREQPPALLWYFKPSRRQTKAANLAYVWIVGNVLQCFSSNRFRVFHYSLRRVGSSGGVADSPAIMAVWASRPVLWRVTTYYYRL